MPGSRTYLSDRYQSMLGKDGMGRQEVVMKELDDNVRKEYNTPKLPFVIGVLGTGVTAEKVAENQVSVGQREAAKAMGAENHVASVESYTEYSQFSNNIFQKGWPEHYHEWDTVGSDRPYHYLGSGSFFVRLVFCSARFLFGWVMHSLVR